MSKKYAAVINLTPCIRIIQRNARKKGEIISDDEAIIFLGEIIKKIRYGAKYFRHNDA